MLKNIIIIFSLIQKLSIIAQVKEEEFNISRYSELAGILVFIIVAVLLIMVMYLSQNKYEKPEGTYVYKKKIRAGQISVVSGTVTAFISVLFFTLIFLLFLYMIAIIILLI